MFKVTSGRKVDDAVWKFFTYEASSDKSVCTIRLSENGDGSATRKCGAVIKGKNATNLKNHIRYKHKNLLSALEQCQKSSQKHAKPNQVRIDDYD
jgi:hypothetical protein